MIAKKQFCYRVKGDVQGVGYRSFTVKSAKSLGLVGTVQNLSDGSVEICATGYESDLLDFEKALWNGPFYSQVNEIFKEENASTNHYRDFTILY